jgi:hypothetical protein
MSGHSADAAMARVYRSLTAWNVYINNDVFFTTRYYYLSNSQLDIESVAR